MDAPAVAPASIERTVALRLCQRRLSPAARLESAANPAIVIVSTVIVKSGIASLRTTELRNPIATAVRAMTEKMFLPVVRKRAETGGDFHLGCATIEMTSTV